MKTIDDIVQRLRAEYLEMPGLTLTREQVERLCGIERHVCQAVLDALVNADFLAAAPDGRYALPTAERVRSGAQRPRRDAVARVESVARLSAASGPQRYDGSAADRQSW